MAEKTKKQTITTKYGTKIDITGLTPEQVTKVRSMAEDKGAYGAKGAALADTFRKKNSTTKTTTNTTTTDTNAASSGIDAKTGGFDNPDDVLANMPDVPGSKDLSADVTAARDAAYNYATQYNKSDKSQELENAKQELAQRGIPIDPTPGSLWSKTIEGIDRKYQSLDDQAKNQAIAQGNQILSTESGVAATASDQFLKAILGMSDADLKRYGINKDYQAKMQAIAAQKRSGGGGSSGGGGGSTDPVIGGQAPGFNI